MGSRRMSDFEFEARLERMFSQPPRVTDPAAFAAQVQGRLERGWTFRRVLLGAGGLLGGGVAASQAFGSGPLSRVGEIQAPVEPLLAELRSERLSIGTDLTALAGSGEVVWIAAAMLALTVGIAATRLSDAF